MRMEDGLANVGEVAGRHGDLPRSSFDPGPEDL